MEGSDIVTVHVTTELLAQMGEWSPEPVYVLIEDHGPDVHPPRYTMVFRTTMEDKPPTQMCRYPAQHHAHEWDEGGHRWTCPGWHKH